MLFGLGIVLNKFQQDRLVDGISVPQNLNILSKQHTHTHAKMGGSFKRAMAKSREDLESDCGSVCGVTAENSHRCQGSRNP